MRILFSYAWSLDAMGGAEVSVRTLAEALVRRGHSVGIVETAGTPSMQPRMHPFGGPMWTVPAPYPGRHPRSWRAVLGSLRRFQGIVSQFKPDIVSVQCPSWQSVSIVCACALPRRWRLVVTARGSDVRNHLWNQPQLRPWLARLCRKADAVTAVSHSLWRDFLKEFPVVRHKGRVIYNGVGPEWFESGEERRGAPGPPYVLFVGRLHPGKGVDLLLRSWKLLRPPTPETALWLAGEGDAGGDLRAIVRELGIAGRVRFQGSISQADLPSLYRGAELVVIPSRNEGLPRVAMEAGACGAVCVATRVGGIPEVIEDGVTGFLTEPESPRALAEVLAHALGLSPECRQRIGAAATSRIRRHFRHDRTVAEYDALFRSLLEPSVGSTHGVADAGSTAAEPDRN